MIAPGVFWQMEFTDPATGRRSGGKRVETSNARLQIILPEFRDSIAVHLKRVNP